MTETTDGHVEGILTYCQAEKERVQSGNTANKPTTLNMSHPPNVILSGISGPPIVGWEEFVSAGGRGGAGLQPAGGFLTGHHRRPGDR